jgi:hypothetical protein
MGKAWVKPRVHHTAQLSITLRAPHWMRSFAPSPRLLISARVIPVPILEVFFGDRQHGFAKRKSCEGKLIGGAVGNRTQFGKGTVPMATRPTRAALSHVQPDLGTLRRRVRGFIPLNPELRAGARPIPFIQDDGSRELSTRSSMQVAPFDLRGGCAQTKLYRPGQRQIRFEGQPELQ